MKLKDLLRDKTRRILLVSEGGAGKSSCVFDAFLYYSQNIEPYNKIPVYIPLNDLESTRNPIYCYFGVHYLNSKSLTEIDEFLGKSKSEYIVFCDGYNEISDETIKSAARNDIFRLSRYHNMSIIICSRYDAPGFTDFEKFTLKKLEDELIIDRVQNYPNLDEHLQELLHTPFNLTLYLGLSLKSRKETIDSSSDLIRLNIKEIPGYPAEPETVREKELHFMFHIALPLLAYKLACKNLLFFDNEQLDATIKEAYNYITYDYYYTKILKSLRGRESDLAIDFCELLKHNWIIYQPNEHIGRFIFIHENYRDFFASYGWILFVEHFFAFIDKDKYSHRFFLPPIKLDTMLSDVIRYTEKTKLADCIEGQGNYKHRQTYFEYLFNITSRHILNDSKAAIFNKIVIDFMKRLQMDFTYSKDNYDYRSRNKPITFYHNFSELDLSLVNFSNCSLLSCDFTGSIMNENAFHSLIPHNMPKELYTDNERVYLRYPTQYPAFSCNGPDDTTYNPYQVLRSIDIRTGFSYELKDRGNPFCIYNGKIYNCGIDLFFNALIITVINAENGALTDRIRINLPECFRYGNALGTPLVIHCSDHNQSNSYHRDMIYLAVLFKKYILFLDIESLKMIGYAPIIVEPLRHRFISPFQTEDKDFRIGKPIVAYCNNKIYTDRVPLYSYRLRSGMPNKSDTVDERVEFRAVRIDLFQNIVEFVEVEPDKEFFLQGKLLSIGMNGDYATAAFQKDDNVCFVPVFDASSNRSSGIDAVAVVPFSGSDDRYNVYCLTAKGRQFVFEIYGKQLLINKSYNLLSVIADGMLTVRQLCTDQTGEEIFKIVLTIPLSSTRYRLGYKGVSDTVEIKHKNILRDYQTDIHRFVKPRKNKGINPMGECCKKAINTKYGRKYLVENTAPSVKTDEHTIIGNYYDALSSTEYVYFLCDSVFNQKLTKKTGRYDSIISYACCTQGKYIVAFYKGFNNSPVEAAVLDLETENVKQKMIFNDTVYDIVYAGSSNDKYEIFLVQIDRYILEVHINLETLERRIVHQTEFFPDVDLFNCRFENVTVVSPDIDLRTDLFLDGETEKILSVWEENNIFPDDNNVV